MQRGFAEFDLMVGDVQYKKTFSEVFRELDWITLEKRSLKMKPSPRCGS